MIYQVTTNAGGEEEVEYSCRNPRCGCYDRRLTRKLRDTPAATQTAAAAEKTE
nr:MAG TPA: hypothetical protein [Caudoviricetes sp.]